MTDRCAELLLALGVAGVCINPTSRARRLPERGRTSGASAVVFLCTRKRTRIASRKKFSEKGLAQVVNNCA